MISAALASADKTLQDRFDQARFAYVEDLTGILAQVLRGSGRYDVKVSGGKVKNLRATSASQVSMFSKGDRPPIPHTVTIVWEGDSLRIRVVTDTMQSAEVVVGATGTPPSKAADYVFTRPMRSLGI